MTRESPGGRPMMARHGLPLLVFISRPGSIHHCPSTGALLVMIWPSRWSGGVFRYLSVRMSGFGFRWPWTSRGCSPLLFCSDERDRNVIGTHDGRRPFPQKRVTWIASMDPDRRPAACREPFPKEMSRTLTRRRIRGASGDDRFERVAWAEERDKSLMPKENRFRKLRRCKKC